MNQEKINRINELYKKQKAGTITPEEKDEQSLLRAEYLAAIRNNLRNTLEHTSIQEPDGTIHKLRKRKHIDDKKRNAKKDAFSEGFFIGEGAQGKKQSDCKTTIYIGRISKSRGGFVISIIPLRSGNDGNESENS